MQGVSRGLSLPVAQCLARYASLVNPASMPSTPQAWTRRLLRCGVAAGPVFVAVFLLEGAVRDGYRPLRHPVSSAPGYGEDGQGAVYVFTSHRGTWSQAAVLTAPDVAGGYLGSGLAISGDRIAAGAPGDGTDSQGSVYIYTGAGRDWSEPVELTASDGDNGWLGNTVQLSGNTLAASAQQAGGGQGAVYVYTDNLGTWSEPTELTASDGDGQLGSSLAFSGDLLAADAPGAGTDSQGAVYIYRGRGLSWSDPVEVTVSDGDNGNLGGIVGLADQELVTAATGAGTLYLFALSRDGWQQRQSFSTPTGGGIGLTDGADQRHRRNRLARRR